MSAIPEFTHEIIEGVTGPCKAYSGMSTAIRTFNGTIVILMAADRVALRDAVREINPGIPVNVNLFMPTVIVHDTHVNRKDNEL